jgi:hypothetical protein
MFLMVERRRFQTFAARLLPELCLLIPTYLAPGEPG